MLQQLTDAIAALPIDDAKREEMLLMCSTLHSEITLLQSTTERDVLGDWLNRRGLFHQAEIAFSAYNHDVYPFVSVAFIDLDKFKAINDTYGHQCGDEVITRVAEVIESSIRKMDIYGRLSGDEFVIILPGASIKAAGKILSRIKRKFCDTAFAFNAKNIPVSLTFGLVSTETDGNTFEELLHKADEEMNAKKGERSR